MLLQDLLPSKTTMLSPPAHRSHYSKIGIIIRLLVRGEIDLHFAQELPSVIVVIIMLTIDMVEAMTNERKYHLDHKEGKFLARSTVSMQQSASKVKASR